MSLAWPALVRLLVFVCYGVRWGWPSLFVVVVDLIFVFLLWCVGWVGGLCAGRVFVYFCVGSGGGARGGGGWL